MTPFPRHLQAAQGFLDLGLPLDAHEELEETEPEMRHLSDVPTLKVPIFETLEKWELMEMIAKELCIRHPDEPNWLPSLAEATECSDRHRFGHGLAPGKGELHSWFGAVTDGPP